MTPVFAGGTSLPEFEALTGMSSYYIEKQIYPYTSYIRNNVNSIVREYNKNGYTTVGIHTNTQTFYNRMNVYKYLGFQQTVFEQNIEKPEIKGGNISDNELANQIINSFEKNKGNKYIFAVSMQNHMPYNNKNYKRHDVELSSDILSESEKLQLSNYVQGVYDGDEMYIKLVNYLKSIEEPTILIMFGDHLPALNSIYEKSEYEGLDYYKTPYVIWANYDIEYEKGFFSEYMSPSNLSVNVMNLSNIETSWYYKKFEELYQRYPVINNKCVITNENKMLSCTDIAQFDIINDCRILQYDLLIKKKYISIE